MIVSPLLSIIFITNFFTQLTLQALISQDYGTGVKDTIIQENGKVVTEDDTEVGNSFHHIPLDFHEVKSARPLRLKKKFYEFYTAPITKFWAHSASSFFFFFLDTKFFIVKALIF